MRLIAFAALAGLLAVRIWDPVPVEILRLKTFDAYQQIHPRAVTPQPVAIVDIDERSIAAFGQWPWPRTLLADLTEKMFAAGAVAAGFDIVFAEPDRMSPARYAGSRTGLDAALAAALARAPDTDEVFAAALARYPVVLGRFPRSETELPDRGGAVAPHAIREASIARHGGDPAPFLAVFAGALPNVPVLESAASGIGMLVPTQDRDNVVRRVPAFLRIGDSIQPTLALEMLRVATGEKTYAIRADDAGISAVSIAGNSIPTDRQGRIWVYYAPEHRDALYVSAADVLAGNADLGGRLVLVGTSAVGLRDLVATPLRAAMPGVEVHAQILETVLSGTRLERPSYGLGAELVALAVVGLAVVLLVPAIGAWWTLAAGTVLMTGLVAGAWHLFVAQELLLDISWPLLASLLVFSLLAFMNYVREQADRRQIRAAFSRYLAPEVVNRLSDNPGQLRLGGEMREMTLLFSDVQGFTGIAENYDAVGLTRLINEILTPITAEVLRTGGTVDKYMGDAVMAFWNAPVDDADHARNACRAALAIQAAKAPLNARLAAQAAEEGHSFAPVNFGVGVNSGECCVGNMGSDMRFDYSVLGDAVNLASRLEGQTRTYGVGIVVGEETRRQARDLAMLELDLIRVKGKTAPVRIFALLGNETLAETAAFRTLLALQEGFLSAYRAQDWQAARDGASGARTAATHAGLDLAVLYDLYESRIEAFAAAPPPRDWDGVYVATTKG